MSWLTEFTSKAETFLNKIDQTTGSALNESGLVTQSSLDPEPVQHIGEISIVKEAPLINQFPSQVKDTPPITPINKSLINNGGYGTSNMQLNRSTDSKITATKDVMEESNILRSNSTPSLHQKKQDDLLFEFLNANGPPTTMTHVRNLSGPTSSTPRKNLDPTLTKTVSQVPHKSNSENSIDVVDAPPLAKENEEVKQPIIIVQSETNPTTEKSDLDVQTESQKEIIKDTKKVDQHYSNLELENKLLKNEMRSLNEELSSTLRNLKDQQQETEKYKLRYENRRSQQNTDYERLHQQYVSQIADLQEALKAKDSQLAVLRVRFDDADAEVKAKTKTLESLQNQNELILKDHSDASGVQGDALVNLRHQLEAVESQLRFEQTENSSIKSELMNLQTKLQSEQHQYAETIKQLQSRQSEGKDKSRELEIKSKTAEDVADSAKQELKEYKDKAARILQAKEKLIASLRQGSDSTGVSPAILSELEEVRQEKELLREELQQNRYKMQQLQSDFQDLEILHDTDTNDNNQKVESLQSSLQEECQKRKHAEEDMKRYMQELQFTREDLHKVKKSQIAEKQEHEAELKKYQHQLNAKVKQNANSSQEELENRIRTLTNSLIQKQTMLEALGTEKNSLVLQLERLEKQYHDIQTSVTRRTKEYQHDIEDPESGSRLQPIASIMPSQITQNRHWKRTVNDIDKFSIRLGVFLRRYPIARLMVIFYMFILHFWVTFVLLTYSPEIHNSDHTPKR